MTMTPDAPDGGDAATEMLVRCDYDAVLDACENDAQRLYCRSLLDRYYRGVACDLLDYDDAAHLVHFHGEIHEHLSDADARNIEQLEQTVLAARYVDDAPAWDLPYQTASEPEKAILRLEKTALRKWRTERAGGDPDAGIDVTPVDVPDDASLPDGAPVPDGDGLLDNASNGARGARDAPADDGGDP